MDYKLLWYPNLFNYALLFDGLERWVLLIKLDWLAQTCNVQNVLPLLLIYSRVNYVFIIGDVHCTSSSTYHLRSINNLNFVMFLMGWFILRWKGNLELNILSDVFAKQI